MKLNSEMTTASIVTYNSDPVEIETLIERLSGSGVGKVFVIDHSSDDSMRKVSLENPIVEYVHQENRGYGAGHNVALRKALEIGADYHVVVNPDIQWTDPVIERLTEYMDSHHECGLVMPEILYPDGRVQHLCKLIPSPSDLLIRRFVPVRKWNERLNHSYEMRWTGYDRIMEIPVLSGCFMFLRCSTLRETGLFDERFFLYAEDVDMCRRIGKVATTMFYPHVAVCHKYAKGSYRNGKMLVRHMISMFKYFNKWGWIHDTFRDSRNRECIDKINGAT